MGEYSRLANTSLFTSEPPTNSIGTAPTGITVVLPNTSYAPTLLTSPMPSMFSSPPPTPPGVNLDPGHTYSNVESSAGWWNNYWAALYGTVDYGAAGKVIQPQWVTTTVKVASIVSNVAFTAAGLLSGVGEAEAVEEGVELLDAGESAIQPTEICDPECGIDGGCFIGGTQVVTGIDDSHSSGPWMHVAQADGSIAVAEPRSRSYVTRSIEGLQPGDVILGRDEENADAPLTPRQVDALFVRTVYQLMIATIRSSTGRQQTICTTHEHPAYVPGRGWIKFRELAEGDELLEPSGETSTVIATRTERHPRGITVYNFRVADSHTYFVRGECSTAEPVWVHNAYSASGVNAPISMDEAIDLAIAHA